MKTERVQETTNIGHLISLLDLTNDQLQDLRYKLRTETKPQMLPFRMSVVTHYRNMKINVLKLIDMSHVSRREAIGLIHHN